MDTMTIQEFIDRFAPCEEARLWLLTQPDIETAWQNCVRSDWMLWALSKKLRQLWALSKLRQLSELESVNLSCRFVRGTPLADGRVVADMLTDPRSIAFLEVKEAWVAGGGGPKPEVWAAARAAARAAAWADAGADAGAAAWAAARADACAAALGAAGEAARAAGEAGEAAWESAQKVQAGIIRSIVPDISTRLSQQ